LDEPPRGVSPELDDRTMAEVKRTLLECVLVGVVGMAVGLAGNAVNPDRVELSENHYERLHQGASSTSSPAAPVSPRIRPAEGASRLHGNGPNGSSEGHANANAIIPVPADDPLVRRVMEEWGYQGLTHQAVAELFRDPCYADGVYIFIDARTADFYTDGHIPGAYNLDHYNRGPTIDAVLQACLGAERIVVYCNGDDCEDSGLAAQDLEKHGVDMNKLSIYARGYAEWEKNGMPVEKGQRKAPGWSNGQ